MEDSESENAEASSVRQLKHEINNALAAIIGYVQLIQLRGEIDEKSRERVDKIEENANRVREMLEQIED